MRILGGLVLAAALAVPAWFLGRLVPIVGGPVFGILLGMLFASIRRPEGAEAGLRFASKQVLQWAIVLLGFGMDLQRVLSVGGESLFVMAFTLTAAFLSAALGARLLGLSGKTPVLIGVGTAICGGSAIAAAAPAIGADDEEVARSISTIFLFNVAAVFLFPALGHLVGLSQEGFGLWAGTAVNDTSSVVAAGYSYGELAGSYATVVKLTRTLFIIPTVLILSLRTLRAKETEAGAGKVRLAAIFPWFVLGFLAATIVGTFVPMPEALPRFLSEAGKFLIVLAMASIGLRTRLPTLLASGWRPLALGLICWFSVAASSLLAQALSGRW